MFSYLARQEGIISLDIPSGLDADSGESFSQIRPRATLTLAFVKSGLLLAAKEYTGELHIADMGIPTGIYKNRLGIKWEPPFSLKSLDEFNLALSERPVWKVGVVKGDNGDAIGWKTKG